MKDIRKLFRFLKPYWFLSVASMVLLTAQVFTDLSVPRLIQNMIDQGIKQQNMAVVYRTSAIMFGMSALSFLFAIANNISSIRVGEGVARDLREAIFTKVQSFAYGDIDRFTTGRLMVRLTSDSSAVQRAFQVTLRIGTRAPLMMIGAIILMFNTSQALAMTIVPLLLVTTAVIAYFSIKMEPLFRSVQLRLDRLNTILQENISGVRLVKAFVRADHENERFQTANLDFTQRNIDVMQFMATMGPVLAMMVNIGIAIVVYVGGLRSIEGSLTIGQIVAFSQYLLRTMGPLGMMTMLSNTWANGFASAKRVNEVLETVPEIQDQPAAGRLPENGAGRVELQNVDFHYKGSNEGAVLCGIDLVANPGETIAILGATGAGKSSLINLIPRFYDPSGGKVLIDGVDIRTVEQDSLLAQVGIVPQETILFSGTVRDNIRYGRPDASDEQVEEAAKAAQAHDFILKLPYGYDTHVEERGVNLSGGQKQRIAIARALATRPRILILDDSTSSVDVETETKIQDALHGLMHNRTTFVVAQRISTVLNASKIIILENGQVCAQGTHTELMKTSPIYREIFDSQLGSGSRTAESLTIAEGAVQYE